MIQKRIWCLSYKKGYGVYHTKRSLVFIIQKGAWFIIQKGPGVYHTKKDLVYHTKRDLIYVINCTLCLIQKGSHDVKKGLMFVM